MKMYYTAEEMHTPEYAEFVQWMASVWKANDERNKRLQAEIKRMEDLDTIAEIEAGCYE
jgi:hypothetical protein